VAIAMLSNVAADVSLFLTPIERDIYTRTVESNIAMAISMIVMNNQNLHSHASKYEKLAKQKGEAN